MSTLQPGSTLQNGEYQIQRKLGQGGFGITYLALQRSLNRQVVVKEFFMDGYCSREEHTHRMTLATGGSPELVASYYDKFLKEARHIAQLEHPNIVSIISVFEENNTAYYVMKYAPNGSLEEKVRRKGHLSEAEATRYILKVAKALRFVHQHKMTHLDVKPANILLSANDEPLLIDFGLSKQYDYSTGKATSHTPIGISNGYAPIEQYDPEAAGNFSPEMDIYSLGATFFNLLTGITPQHASIWANNGIPVQELHAKNVSQRAISVIFQAMEPLRKDRLHDMDSFISLLEEGPVQRPTKQPATQPLSQPYTVQTIISGETEPAAGVQDKEQAEATMTIEVAGISFKMIRVEGGTFTMGATPEQEHPYNDEKPAHQVTLSSYYIGETEVTQALWTEVMGTNPSCYKGENLPVDSVSWNDCQEFLQRLNVITNQNFRLPTEAEWEFAARGGNKSSGYQYSGSNEIDRVAWHSGNSSRKSQPVKNKVPNELGIYDMSGNLWEWCSDWKGDYSSKSQINPTGPQTGKFRVYRGGSWFNDIGICRCAYRGGQLVPDKRSNTCGLRLAFTQNTKNPVKPYQAHKRRTPGEKSKKLPYSIQQQLVHEAEKKRIRNLLIVIATMVVCVAIAALLNKCRGYTIGGAQLEIDSVAMEAQWTNETKTFDVNGVSFTMIPVEGGTFTMGATSEMKEAFSDEEPTHQVTLSSYYIGETEVTQALWEAVMGSNPSFSIGDNLPVESVSWDDCQTFISRLSSLTGKRFRLPTEAEWEFAARGGNQSRHTRYSGSSRIDNVAWYDENSDYKTHPVKIKQPNELGLYDMSGNVREWCQDWYGSYSSYAQTDPTGAGSGSDRVIRDGSWSHTPWGCRSSYRGHGAPELSDEDLGLRLALSL